MTKWPSGGGTHRAFAIEVCSVLDKPFTFPGTDFIVTPEWRVFPIQIKHCDIHTPHFHGGMIGDIPVQNWMCRHADEMGLMDFQAAYTMACIIQTKARGLCTGHAVRTRLVEVEVKYSFEGKEVGVGQEVNLYTINQEAKYTSRSEGVKCE